MLEMLQNLSQTIERELHAIHELTQSTIGILERTVISQLRSKHPFMNQYSFHELVQHKSRPNMNSNELIDSMQPFPKQILQTIIHSMQSLKNPVIQQLTGTIVIDAYELFPSNPEIYLAYCLHKIHVDKHAFFDTYIASNNKFLKQTNDITTKVFAYILSVLIVCGVLFAISAICTQSNAKESEDNTSASDFRWARAGGNA